MLLFKYTAVLWFIYVKSMKAVLMLKKKYDKII